jgi:hypothetical protein
VPPTPAPEHKHGPQARMLRQLHQLVPGQGPPLKQRHQLLEHIVVPSAAGQVLRPAAAGEGRRAAGTCTALTRQASQHGGGTLSKQAVDSLRHRTHCTKHSGQASSPAPPQARPAAPEAAAQQVGALRAVAVLQHQRGPDGGGPVAVPRRRQALGKLVQRDAVKGVAGVGQHVAHGVLGQALSRDTTKMERQGVEPRPAMAKNFGPLSTAR